MDKLDKIIANQKRLGVSAQNQPRATTNKGEIIQMKCRNCGSNFEFIRYGSRSGHGECKTCCMRVIS